MDNIVTLFTFISVRTLTFTWLRPLARLYYTSEEQYILIISEFPGNKMQTEKKEVGKQETNNVFQVAALTSASCTVWSLVKSSQGRDCFLATQFYSKRGKKYL